MDSIFSWLCLQITRFSRVQPCLPRTNSVKIKDNPVGKKLGAQKVIKTGINILAQNDKLFPDGLSPDHKLFPQYKGRYKTEEPAYWIMFNVSMPIKIMEAEG